MDDARDSFSFSRLKKGIKRRLKRSRGKGDGSEAGKDGERVGSPQPGPAVVVGSGREGEGNGSDAGDKSVGPSAAADKNKSDWKSTASASAKLLLYGVRDSADAFPPLKSVAGGLCFILENCEVCPSPLCATYNAYRRPSERKRISKR